MTNNEENAQLAKPLGDRVLVEAAPKHEEKKTESQNLQNVFKPKFKVKFQA